MGAPKPTLGYPSRTEACLALLAQGQTKRQIADRIGISATTVDALLQSASRRGTSLHQRHGARQRPDHRTVVFEIETLNGLAVHAARRAVSVNVLARRLVETIVENDLVSAVLDDDAPAQRHEKESA